MLDAIPKDIWELDQSAFEAIVEYGKANRELLLFHLKDSADFIEFVRYQDSSRLARLRIRVERLLARLRGEPVFG